MASLAKIFLHLTVILIISLNQAIYLSLHSLYRSLVSNTFLSPEVYTQDDINKLASHINSTARDSLNGATSLALAKFLIDKRIPVLTGQFEVSSDEVMLKPDLLNK